MNRAGDRRVVGESDFAGDLVEALMVEGYNYLFACCVVDGLRVGVIDIDPFDGDFHGLRRALESLGVFDKATMLEKLGAK